MKKLLTIKRGILISGIFVVIAFAALSTIVQNVSQGSLNPFSVDQVSSEVKPTVSELAKGTPMPIDFVNDLPAKMELSFSATPVLGRVVALSLLVEPKVDAKNTGICILLPEGFSLVSGNLWWRGDVSENIMVQMDVFVRAESIGSWRLEAVAISEPSDGYPRVCSTHRYVSVTDTETTVSSFTSEDMTQMEAMKLDTKNSPYNDPVTPLSPGTVTVYGYWYYEDEDYNLKPARYARVELWDDDFPVDVLLATTYVQSNGYYQFSAITNDDGPGEDGYDVYVKLFCDSHQYQIVYVTDGINTYWGQTTKHDNVSDGYYNMGSWKITGSGRECWGLYDNVVDGYWWLRNRVSWYRSKILVRWPYETWPHCHGNTIDIPSGWEWQRMTTLHEYAHCIHYAARGGSWPPGTGPSPHYIYSESSGGFAITEGWAEFMQCAVDNRGDYGFGTNETIESNTWADRIDSGDWDGNIVEGAVASIFWDIFDGTSSIDEDLGDYVNQEFSKLWTVFLNDDPNDMETYFRNGWESRYGVDFSMWAIYYGSRINKDTTPPSAPIISSTTHPDENKWYPNNDPTFNWTAPSDLSGIAGYSYLIDQSSLTVPDTTVDTTENSESYANLADGTWYFHVRAKDNAGSWGSTDHYAVKIDTTPPVAQITNPNISSPIYKRSGTTLTANYTYTELNPKNSTIKVYNATQTIGETVLTDPVPGVDVTRNDPVNIVAWAAEGAYNVTVIIYDLADQDGEDTQTNTLIIDNVLPTVDITYPSEGANVVISLTVWVNGTVTELNKGDLEPAINDTRFDLAHWDSATGSFAYLNNTNIPEGATSVKVNFTDLAGNTDLDTVTFTLVPPPPELQPEGGTSWYWVDDSTITSIVEGDVDSDGSPEIVTGGYYYDGTRKVAQVAVWNGSTLELEGVTTWYWTGNTTITSVAIGDLDGDSEVEIVTSGCYHDGVRKVAQLAMWDGATLSFENATVWSWVGDTNINSVAIADIDHDGTTEIITAGHYDDGTRDVAQLAVWEGQTLSLERITVWYWVGNTTITSVATGDVDGDTLNEIVTGGYYYDGAREVAQLAVWNGSTLELEGVAAWYWVGDTRINSVAVGDVDGDGSTEIVTGGYYYSDVKTAQLATWHGIPLSLENATVWSWTDDTNINSVAIGDVDGDGSVEIVTGGSYNDGAYDSAQLIVWGGSDLTLETFAAWRWVSDTRINSVAVGDVDGDSIIETVTGGNHNDNTRTVAQLTIWIVTSG